MDSEIDVISDAAIEPICHLKTDCLHSSNPRLHSDETLIALSISSATDPLAARLIEHVEDLREWGRRGIAPVVANERFGRIRLTHVNLDDGTAEGFAFLEVPAFSVQYHPEAAPGPTDAHYLFTAFARLMEGREDYLDIDIATDRLSGWKFGADTEREVA